MRIRFVKIAGTVALVRGVVVSGGTVANAATTYPPEGGTWTHGKRPFGGTTEEAYSNYYHGAKRHGAVAWWGGDTKRNWVYANAGWTARASDVKAPAILEVAKAGYSVN